MEHLISAIYDLENSYASFYLQEEGIEKEIYYTSFVMKIIIMMIILVKD